jgi:general secretion pathway protein C
MLDALNPEVFARRSALLARIALVFACAVALVALLRLASLFAFGPGLPEPAAPPAPAIGASTAAAEPAPSIAAWHLFGNAQGPIDLAALAQTAPATALRLVLRGTLNEHAPEGGIAIITDESGTDHAYRVGDTLPGDAKLEGIYAGRVLLSRNGANESLSLPSATDAPPAASAPRTTPGRAPGASPSVPGIPRNTAAPAPFVTPMIAPGAPSLDSIRAATGTDPAELAKQVQIYPVMENGRMAGVRLTAGRDSDILSRAGLRPTDIVTAVNGIPLDGPQRSGELMTALKDARTAQVTVRRDGKDMQLTIGLR